MDWKGAALVLQQLGELRKPSQLEIAEKEYEIEAKETEAKRRHELALASLEGIQSNIENLDKLLVEKVKAGNDIAIGLSSIGKKENISGNAASLNEQLYSQEFADYEGARKDLNTQYNDKYDQLNEQIQINNAAGLGKQFVETNYELGGENYFNRAQVARDDYGNVVYDAYNKPILDSLTQNLSYEEAKYAVELAANENFEDDISKQSFITGAMASLKQPEMKKATDTARKSQKTEIAQDEKTFKDKDIIEFQVGSSQFTDKAKKIRAELLDDNIGNEAQVRTFVFENSTIKNNLTGTSAINRFSAVGDKSTAATINDIVEDSRGEYLKYNESHRIIVLDNEFRNDGLGVESDNYKLTSDNYQKVLIMAGSEDMETRKAGELAMQLFHIAHYKYDGYINERPDGYPIIDGDGTDLTKEFPMNNVGLKRMSKAILKMIEKHYKEPEESESSYWNSLRSRGQIRQ